MDFTAEQQVDRDSQHHQPTGHVQRQMRRREELAHHRGAQRDRQNHRGDAAGEDEGHRDQHPSVLEGAGEIGGEHDREAARREERDHACHRGGNHRTAKEDATAHPPPCLSPDAPDAPDEAPSALA
jgi:hypothetical protein